MIESKILHPYNNAIICNLKPVPFKIDGVFTLYLYQKQNNLKPGSETSEISLPVTKNQRTPHFFRKLFG